MCIPPLALFLPSPDTRLTLLLLYPPFCIVQVSLESGLVLNFDSRTLSSFADLKNPLASTPAKFTLAAHEGAASSLDVSPHVRGCLATGGTDKLVKVWNIDEEDTSRRQVSMVTSRDVGVVRSFFPLLPLASFLLHPSIGHPDSLLVLCVSTI